MQGVSKPKNTSQYSPKFAPGWLRSQFLAAVRRNGHKKLLNQIAKDDPKWLLEQAIKLEPKDINQQTTVNIKVVSLPGKAQAGQIIEPAEYKIIPDPVKSTPQSIVKPQQVSE